MTKHTELPWISVYDDNGFYHIQPITNVHNPYIVATGNEGEMDEANAAFIVRACNSFYPMLDALKQAVLIASDENGEVFNGNLREREVYIRNWKQNAIAALSKATPNTEEAKGER